MKTTKALTIIVVTLVMTAFEGRVCATTPTETTFTYQGRLIYTDQPADGLYDLQFKLYDANVGGNKVGDDVNFADVDVIDGYLTVQLDFGSDVFNGDARWLEIGVRPGELNDPNAYAILSPRQKITSSAKPNSGRAVTVVVAASDSSALSKLQADYVCTGTNDQDTINAAIDALPPGGGEVKLLEGNYGPLQKAYTSGNVKGSIRIVNRSNVVLSGVGTATRLTLGAGQNCSVIRIYGDGIGNITIRDLYINGNRANNGGSDPYFEVCGIKAFRSASAHTHDIIVENCYIEECHSLGVFLYGDGTYIRNNTLGNAGYDVAEITDGYGAITGNHVRITGTVESVFTLACSNSEVSHNIIEIPSGGRVEVSVIATNSGFDTFRINDNTIDFRDGRVDVGEETIKVTGRKTIVSNNIMYGNSNYPALVSVLAGECTFTNNKFDYGKIVVNNTASYAKSIIENNFFWGASGANAKHIVLTRGVVDVIGNYFYGNGTGTTTGVEISTGNTEANNIRIVGNEFDSWVATPISNLSGINVGGVWDNKSVASIKQNSRIGILNTVAGVNMTNGAGPTTLYTVPTGKTAIITGVVVRNPTASLAGGASYSFTNWRTVNLSGMTAPNTSYCLLSSDYSDTTAFYTTLSAGTNFQITVTAGSTAEAYATIDVIGYEY